MKLLLAFFYLFLLLSPAKAQGIISEQYSYNGEDLSDMQSSDVDLDSLRYYCNIVNQHNKMLKEKLQTMTKADLENMISTDDYTIDDATFAQIENYAMPSIMRWSEGQSFTVTDTLVFKEIENAGFKVVYEGEGFGSLSVDLQFYSKMFDPYIDSSSKKFLELEELYRDVIFMDAGLVISLNEVANRCVLFESFLQEYPNSIYCSTVLSFYYYYMQSLLFCDADNTRSFDYSTGIIYDYIYDNLNALSTQYSGTQTGRIIKTYLKELNAHNREYSEPFEQKIMNLWRLGEVKKEL